MATHHQPAIRQLILVLAAVTIAGGGIVYGKINEVPGNDHLFVSSPPVNRPPNPANIPRLPDSHHTVGPDNDRVVGWAFTVDADAASGPPTSHTAPAPHTAPVPQSSPASHTAPAPHTAPVPQSSPAPHTAPVPQSSPAPHTAPTPDRHSNGPKDANGPKHAPPSADGPSPTGSSHRRDPRPT